MNKYFEVLPISEKPEKDGWYDLIDEMQIVRPTSYYLQSGIWYDGKPEEEGWPESVDPVDVHSQYTHWLRPLTSLPIDRETAEKIAKDAYDAGAASIHACIETNRSTLFDTAKAKRDKETYLKQFS